LLVEILRYKNPTIQIKSQAQARPIASHKFLTNFNNKKCLVFRQQANVGGKAKLHLLLLFRVFSATPDVLSLCLVAQHPVP